MVTDGQRGNQQPGTAAGRSSAFPGQRIARAFRDGWIGPPRPNIALGVLLVACVVLAAGGFFRRGGMDPAQGTVFTGFAVTAAADFMRGARRGLVVAVRVVGTVVALIGLILTVL